MYQKKEFERFERAELERLNLQNRLREIEIAYRKIELALLEKELAKQDSSKNGD